MSTTSKSWMRLKNKFCDEYRNCINSFMRAIEKCAYENNCVCCPCQKYLNAIFRPLNVVYDHLYKSRISRTYDIWVYHGEKRESSSFSCRKELETADNSNITHVHDDIFDILDDLRGPITEFDAEPPNADGFTFPSEMEDFNTCEVSGLLNDAHKMPFSRARLSLLSFIGRLM